MWSGSEVVVLGGGRCDRNDPQLRNSQSRKRLFRDELNWKKLVLLICSSSFFNSETKVDEGRRSCCSSSETTLNV